MRLTLFVFLAQAACLEPRLVHCEDGNDCPRDRACSSHGCVMPAQLDACDGVATSTPCNFAEAPGTCFDGVCLPHGCGNRIVEGNEDCDGVVLPAADCTTVGFYAGTLSCTAGCLYDTSACIGSCGDGILDANESCDGTDLDTRDCRSFGYYEADGLACNTACTFDISTCTGRCGDGVYQTGNELCDPVEDEAALGARGLDCTDFGFYAPAALQCASFCQFDTASCGGGFCGDGVRQASEDCDGTDLLAGTSCSTFGYYNAAGLACRNNCTFDFSSCTERCGDHIVNGPEQCDGSVPPGTDCTDFGVYGPDGLTCNAACAYDTSTCAPLSCPVGYNSIGVGVAKFRIVSQNANWATAELDCADDSGANRSTHLWIVNSLDEKNAILAVTGSNMWVGTTDRRVEGEFRNVTGAQPAYTPWGNSEPSNSSNNEHCVEQQQNGTWNDTDCNNNRDYVCECDGKPEDLASF